MRALYFAGEYASPGVAEAKACFLEATHVADDCLTHLRMRATEGSSRDLSRATPVELVPRLAGDPEAASAFEWGGVAWGMYALAEGMFAAAREGVAGRIRDYAEAVIRLAPALDDAAGDRTLGRLHHKTPSIPLDHRLDLEEGGDPSPPEGRGRRADEPREPALPRRGAPGPRCVEPRRGDRDRRRRRRRYAPIRSGSSSTKGPARMRGPF